MSDPEFSRDESVAGAPTDLAAADHDDVVETSAADVPAAELLPVGDLALDVPAEEAAAEAADAEVDAPDEGELAADDEPVDAADEDAAEEAASGDAEVLSEEEAIAAPEPDADEIDDDPWTRPGQWYVVHTQSGYEKKVTANLHARIQSMNMEDSIYEVVVPMEDVVEIKNGKKVNVQRKVFPGYLLVRCEMTDESWYCIRNTPGVTGFVGQSERGQKPAPLRRKEVRTFLAPKTGGADAEARPKPKLDFEESESVRVKEGPFADFLGTVAEINADHMKLKVLVNIFGRETLVEMDFSQVAKL